MFKDVYFKRLAIIFLSVFFLITAAGVTCLKLIGSESKQQHPQNNNIADMPPIPSLEIYIDIYISDEVKEFLRTASPKAAQARVREIDIARHYRAYPDCREYDAVLKEAERQAAWYVAYKTWEKKETTANKDWWQIVTENDEFFKNFYENMSTEEHIAFLKNTSEAEKAAFIAKMKDWRRRSDAAWDKLEKLRKEEPIEPTPQHTHGDPAIHHSLLNY